jgi:outer membrane protein TolC
VGRWSWDRIADLVRTHAPTLAIADSQLQQAQLRALEARLASLPSFAVRFGIAPAPRVEIELDENGNPIQSSAQQSDLELATNLVSVGMQGSLDITTPIYTFGKIQLARQLASVGVDVELAEREKAVLDALFEARRAFLVLQWYERVDALMREAEQRLTEARETLEDQLMDGDTRARSSLRRLTIANTQVVELRASADQVETLARSGLTNALGLPPGVQMDRLQTVDDRVVPELEDILAWARLHRPDYDLLQRAVRAAELRARLEARQFAPDLAFLFSVNGAYAPSITNLRGPFIFDPYNRFGFGMSIGLRWSLQPAMRGASTARFFEAADEARLSQAAAWLAIETEVTEAWAQARARLQVVLSYADARAAAEAWLNQVAFQYDQGLATFDDLREPLQTYYQVGGNYYKAWLDYQLAVASLAVKCGSPWVDRWPTDPPPSE